MVELQARLQAVLRRCRSQPAEVMTVGPLHIDIGRHQAHASGRRLELTRKEFQLLVALARTPNVVVPRQRLVSEVWQTSWLGKSRTVDVHVATLRAKLAPVAGIENLRGVGYRLAVRDDAGRAG